MPHLFGEAASGHEFGNSRTGLVHEVPLLEVSTTNMK